MGIKNTSFIQNNELQKTVNNGLESIRRHTQIILSK